MRHAVAAMYAGFAGAAVASASPKRKHGQEWSTRTEFHIGLGEDAEGHTIPEIIRPMLIRESAHVVSDVYGGATIVPHFGGWVSPEGKYIQEPGVTIVAYGHSNQMRDVCQRILMLTNQRALIAVTIGAKLSAVEVFRD